MPPRKPRKREPELEFQAEVLALCEGRNLWPVLVNPQRFAQRVACNQGFPDVVIYGPGGVLYRELKMTLMAGRGLNPKQIIWRDRIQSHGGNWGIWTPRDRRDGRIERELAGIETPGEHTDEFSLALLGVPRGDGQGDEAEDPAAGRGKLERDLPWVLAAGAIAVIAGAIKSG